MLSHSSLSNQVVGFDCFMVVDLFFCFVFSTYLDISAGVGPRGRYGTIALTLVAVGGKHGCTSVVLVLPQVCVNPSRRKVNGLLTDGVFQGRGALPVYRCPEAR